VHGLGILVLAAGWAGAVLVAGCAGSSASPAPPPTVQVSSADAGTGAATGHEPLAADAEPSGAISCQVEVAALGETVTGEASGEGKVDPSDEAWRGACAALRAKHGLACEDEARVLRAGRQEQITVTNGHMTRLVRINLRPILAELEGAGASDRDYQDACLQAVERACRRAPKGSSCGPSGILCEPVAGHRTRWHCSRRVRSLLPAKQGSI
jgi:hypothetical protein